MWTEHERSQWDDIRDKLSEILGRDITNEIVTNTILEFIELFQEKVSK